MNNKTSKITPLFSWGHGISYLAGILAFLVPFIDFWKFGSTGNIFTLRQGHGYFGYNMIIGLTLGGVGTIVIGYWWRLISWISGGAKMGHFILACGLLATACSGLIEELDRNYYFYIFSAVIIAGLIYALINKEQKERWLPPWSAVKSWFKESAHINIAYFIILFAIFVFNNTLALIGLESSFMEKASLLTGRILFFGGFISVFCLIIELLLRATPPKIRFIPWIFLGMIPLICIADMWSTLALKRPIRAFVNSLTSSGEFDLQKELNAGIQGVEFTIFQCYLMVGAFILVAMAFSFITWKLSKKSRIKVSAWGLLMFFMLFTGLSIAEQGIGSHWKSLAFRQAVSKTLTLKLGLFAPPKGIGSYLVEFLDPPELPVASGKATTRPDIYVIMVESMRGDALRKEITPFLVNFAKMDCQPIQTGCAGSNATHLSWFSMMHSQVPVFWRTDLESIPDRNNYNGAAPLQWLKKSGYNIEVRAVCDLGYKDFGLLNFGSDKKLASVVEDSISEAHFSDLSIPEREVIIFNHLKKSIQSRTAGGNFYYTALDAPHYGYYWNDNFKPPYDEYIPSASFPLMPSENEIKLYKQRYWNACAWVDHQVKEFVEFLKKEGRYDESIIIVTGDHGEEFQERGGWCHCSSVFPEQVEVPLLIKWPKAAGRGSSVLRASHLDVMPSLLSYLGAPNDVLNSLAGVNIREKRAKPQTIITTTNYAGGNGETMVMRRGDYAAFFSWGNYWLAEVPTEMALERIEYKGVPMVQKNPEAYNKKLQEIFSDTQGRFFKKLEFIPDN